MNITAFTSYIFLTTITPGPNNIMAMAAATSGGMRRALRFCMGVLGGFLVDLALCAVFTSLLYRYIPAVEPVMRWVGAAYILFLACKIWRDKPAKVGKGSHLQPGSFAAGLVMQFVNVKVLLYGITVMSTFVLPHTRSVPVLAAVVVGLSLAGFAGTCCWALFGSLFQRVFTKHRRGFNAVMALSLVACAVLAVLG